MRSTSLMLEALEQRMLLSAAPVHAYAPDAIVRGQSIPQWVADWWTQVFQAPVHAADGSFLNPLIDPSAPTSQGNVGRAFYLFGSFLGGHIDRTATVPTGTPIFVPVLPVEFSNFDTTTGNVPGGTLPGTNTAAQLMTFDAQAALPALGPGGSLHLSVDGKVFANVGSYREVAPTFSYVLPSSDNVDQFFFGQANLQGLVSPAEADGFYVMLQPLPPGQHVIDFGGVTPGGSLGPLNESVTYTINVVPKGQYGKAAAAASPPGRDDPSSSLADDTADWLKQSLE